MKAVHDRSRTLTEGLAAIREQFQLPAAFPPEVEIAAEAAARRPLDGHVDRTATPFVTLDPLSSTDLDQAFAIEEAGGDLILSYAIADVGAYVRQNDPVDREAWTRGETIYLPDGRVSLYPKVLSEGAASLLPGADKRAILFRVRVAQDGSSKLDGAERALVRSRAKLGYARVTRVDLPPQFDELARRVSAAETARGAARIDPPQQEVVECANGGFSLAFRPMSAIERANAAMSLAANLAIAELLYQHGTGLFRTMPEPGQRAMKRLRHTAKALGVDWPTHMPLKEREATLDPNEPKDAAFMLAIRRAGRGAAYVPFTEGETPWHSAMAATYAHGTAPLRRLADRYVTEATLAIAGGGIVPAWVEDAFTRLPDVMNRADAKAAQVDSAVVELAESVVLAGHVGRQFEGRVTDIDDRGARIQLCDEAVVTRVPVNGLEIGEPVELKLVEAEPALRLARFELG